MLSFQTVLPDTLELLKRLMCLPLLKETRLVGGTALALQYGHRRSVDLDFFGRITENTEELTEELKKMSQTLVTGACSKSIKIYTINGIKVDIVNYNYDWIDNAVVDGEIRLASPSDIAAMKFNAIIGRGTKKDFVDIYYLLQHFTFEEIMSCYLRKYPEGSEYRALLSMTYFEDADSQPMPFMFDKVEWPDIKHQICREVEKYNQRHI